MNKKNSWFAAFVVFLFFVCQTGIFAQKSGYKIVQVELPWGKTVLYSTFYCFNDLETGRNLAEELYGVKNLDKILKAGRFRKLMAIPVGSELSAYNFAIMTYNKEFWFFESRDDGWLWGTGRY
ncbi:MULTISPECIES: hypothetical protein [unclassified Treponema]|uniref:hypothetical protein n=1 Tax=unclassified Treponema TaxID=2638727 RepID=UPI0025CEBAD6|nr:MULTISPECIES: hypothetical protein [unclassified Treponema]